MGLRINTNTAAMHAQYQLRNNSKSLSTTMERLASGSKINRSADDTAGLANSENTRANIRGLKQSERNAQDGISFTQIAEGGLNEISGLLLRLRDLSIQSASDTVSDSNRELISLEYNQMLEEIDRLANSTEYNGTKLLSGTGKKIDFQINTKNSDQTDRISFDPAQADVSTTSLGLENTGTDTKIVSQNALDKIDGAISTVSELRGLFGSIQSRLDTASQNILTNIENLSASNSRVKDTDVAEESSELARKNLMLQAGTSILAQANQQPGQALALLNKG